MVDEDDEGELVAARQSHPEHDVGAVAEDIAHPHRPVGRRLRQAGEPLRSGDRPGGQFTPDTDAQEVVVTGDDTVLPIGGFEDVKTVVNCLRHKPTARSRYDNSRLLS